jgi:EF hand domain-containing protein
MKLVGFSFVAMLGLAVAVPGAARADEVLQPPSGPVYVVADPPVEVQAVRIAPGAPAGRDPQRAAQRRAQLQALRAALLQAFDKNGDGRLGPRERMHAIKVLQRIEKKLAQGGGPNRQGKRQMMMRRFIQRYDMNGDGQVGPREMPPAAADRLRRFDRNRDGWVEPNEIE